MAAKRLPFREILCGEGGHIGAGLEAVSTGAVHDGRPCTGRLNAARGKYAVIVPPELEEKLDGNTELAQDIFCKITALAMQQDTVPRTIDSFSIALDKDGNIANYRFSGGGGQLMFPYGTLLERNAAQKDRYS